ncbi:MAG: phosphoribosyltransferase [Pseudanabaena sp. CAN_BIN31]|nr:phosphoribosyltransferase [Pseudanabaena sp. CAN_BIN31]
MAGLSPRRAKLTPQCLRQPISQGKDWSLSLPFSETFSTTFDDMCAIRHNGFREGNGNYYTYLKGADDADIVKVENWISTVGSYVVIRDLLYLSFAIDYTCEDGNPDNSTTEICKLRQKAKLYDASSSATESTYIAADELLKLCMQFLLKIDCYTFTDAIVAMPASRPDKNFDLPSYLAGKISQQWGKVDLSHAVNTIKSRPSVKNQETTHKKLEALEGSVQIDQNIFQGKSILILDDLYQSGVSMNYVAMLLQEAGATKVLGLACEKTCRNDANRSRR